MKKFMDKGYKIIEKVYQIQIIKNKKNSISKIKTKNGFLISIQTKNELSNINYDLIYQRLVHHGKIQPSSHLILL